MTKVWSKEGLTLTEAPWQTLIQNVNKKGFSIVKQVEMKQILSKNNFYYKSCVWGKITCSE